MYPETDTQKLEEENLNLLFTTSNSFLSLNPISVLSLFPRVVNGSSPIKSPLYWKLQESVKEKLLGTSPNIEIFIKLLLFNMKEDG